MPIRDKLHQKGCYREKHKNTAYNRAWLHNQNKRYAVLMSRENFLYPSSCITI